MADRPIIFSAPMIRALLEGRKSQTRRVLKPQPEQNSSGLWCWPPYGHKVTKRTWRGFCQTDEAGIRQWFVGDHKATEALPARPGDRLWVRETWAEGMDAPAPDGAIFPIYAAHWGNRGTAAYNFMKPWRSAMFMPRKYSRLTLIVTDVRVQWLQDISCVDAIAEGIPRAANSQTIDCDTPDPRNGYRALWNSLNAKRGYSWESNPWVCALTFDVVKKNIDAMEAA